MAIKEPEAAPAVGGKGLQAGAIGLVGNVVIGLAAVAPAYSLAATLGYVVLAVGEKAPSMFVLAFIPMLLVAFAYKELSTDTPDCGTTFTWGTKAFGPWIGWIGGWGLAVSAIIVLANVAEVAAIYLFKFLGQDELADNLFAKVLLGSFFIIAMTLLSARGIVVSEKVQNVLIAIQFGVLIVASIIALIRVFSGTAGAQAISPQLSWLWPSGLDMSSIAAAIILCVFIYWGWDACLAVGEETKDPGRTPGIAALITTLILVCTYVLVAYAVQSFSGFGDVGIGLNNAMNTDDVLTVLGEPVAGPILASLLLLTVSVSGLSSTQTTILPTARGTLSMAVYEAIPKRFASVHPRYMTPAFGTIVMGLVGTVLLPGAHLPFGERTRRFDRLAGTRGRVLLRHHRVRMRVVLPQDTVRIGQELLLPRSVPVHRRRFHGGGVRHQRQGHDRSRVRLHRVRFARRRLRPRCRHARARYPTDARLLRIRHQALLPRRDAERQHRSQGPRRLLREADMARTRGARK